MPISSRWLPGFEPIGRTQDENKTQDLHSYGLHLLMRKTPLAKMQACFMLLCMRTTIDMPDQLLRRVKKITSERNMTFRALVIDALEKALAERTGEFRLRDASVGTKARRSESISPGAVNRAIDAQRESPFRQ